MKICPWQEKHLMNSYGLPSGLPVPVSKDPDEGAVHWCGKSNAKQGHVIVGAAQNHHLGGCR